MRRLRLAGLLVFAFVGAGLLMSEIEPVGIGWWLHGLVGWLVLYPFVVAAGWPVGRYWLVLAGLLPAAWLAHNAGPLRPALMVITLVAFVTSLIVLTVRRLRSHR